VRYLQQPCPAGQLLIVAILFGRRHSCEESEYHDNSAGVVEHQTVNSDEGFKVAVAELQKQVEYLKQQNTDLLAAITGKK
jgi:hypothetical protein